MEDVGSAVFIWNSMGLTEVNLMVPFNVFSLQLNINMTYFKLSSVRLDTYFAFWWNV